MRWAVAAVAAVVLSTAAAAQDRSPSWLQERLESGFAEALGGTVRIGKLDVEWTALAATVGDVEIVVPAEGAPPLTISIANARVKLAWSGLTSIGGGSIHITELGIPSANDRRTLSTYEERGRTIPYPIDAVWHGTDWSETIQADWVEQFYTLCYSKPAVEAVSWWDFRDPGYMPNGGLIAADYRPKESYQRLAGLVERWRPSRGTSAAAN